MYFATNYLSFILVHHTKYIYMQYFTYYLFITVIIPSKVFVKSKMTKFYTKKKSFKALIFILKLKQTHLKTELVLFYLL